MFGSLLKHGLKHGRIHLIDHHGREQTYGSGAPEITLRLLGRARKRKTGAAK